MHFFRSEEHLRNWAGFNSEIEGGIISLSDLVQWFSVDFFRKRMDPDYFSRRQEYMGEFVSTLGKIGKVGSFWLPGSQ